MTVKVLVFSLLQDIVGGDELSLELPGDEIMVADFLAHLYQAHPGLKKWDRSLLVSADLDYVGRDDVLRSGQEVALMPPVQGG